MTEKVRLHPANHSVDALPRGVLGRAQLFRLELRRASLFSQGNLFFYDSNFRSQMFVLHIALLSRMKEAVTAPPHNKYRSILQSLRLESCVQLLLASHNLSGMSYFGGLGRNILCNVSLSQGNKFLRPPAVSMVPCFHARRIRTRLCLNSPIRVKLRASQAYFHF